MPQRLRRLNADASPLARFGARLRDYRMRHGLAQAELGRAVHVSGTLIAKMERAERRPQPDVARNLDQRLGAGGELARLAADALKCPITPPAGIETPPDIDARLERCLGELRLLADIYDLPEDGPVRPLELIQRSVDDVVDRRLNSDYRRLANVLPELIAELTRAVVGGSGRDQEVAAGLLAQVWRGADAIACKLGHPDLCARLIHVMDWAAAQSGDGLAAAATAYVRAETFFTSGQATAGHRMLEAAAGRLEHGMNVTASREAAAQYGSLHMRAAIAAARAYLPERAMDHLDVAHAMASIVAEEGVWEGTAFGPASVRIHQVHTAVELKDHAQAVAVASGWTPPEELPAERRSHFYVDKARAEFELDAYDEAFHSLELAREIAPQNIAMDPTARAVLRKLDGARPARAYQFRGPSGAGPSRSGSSASDASTQSAVASTAGSSNQR
jgi:transcriptional regulator with XRE-family HTH domain